MFDNPVLAQRLADTIRPGLGGQGAPHRQAGPHPGRGYYTGLALRVTADQGQTELGDGGFTSWTAQLTTTPRNAASSPASPPSASPP